MKKTYSILLLSIIAFVLVMADNTIKVLRIYSEGSSTTIPLENIDSINHSKYDADSILNTDYVTSVTWSIDSIYRFSIDSIDSMVVANVDIEKYKFQIGSIQEYILAQGEVEVQQFQTDLISWLNRQDWVKEVTINENKNLITVIFDNGLEFFVDYLNASFYDRIENNSARYSNRTSANEQNTYDVSVQQDENIIEKLNVLYIQARHMALSNASSEKEQLEESLLNDSPILFDIHSISHDLHQFQNQDLTHYGMVLISQTHGTGEGGFQFGDKHFFTNFPKGVSVIVRNGNIDMIEYQTMTNDYLYWIMPRYLNKKIANNKNIIYGNYCWSASNNFSFHGAFVGYKNKSNYFYNKNAMTKFVDEMAHGSTVKDAVKHVEKKNFFKYGFDPQLCIKGSEQASLKRYFSISIDSITRRSNKGNPIITGRIKGYNNLKNNITSVVYLHEGDGIFTPESDDVKKISGDFIDSNGTFEYEHTGELKYDTKYGFIIGFEFDGKVYYGEVKFFEKQTPNLCPDNNHPHKIDLGLPSGTLWSCRNVGASSPGDVGNHYAWGEMSTKPNYNEDTYRWHGEYSFSEYTKYNMTDKKTELEPVDDVANQMGDDWHMPTIKEMEELIWKNNCKSEWTTIDGVWGRKFTSKVNGNAIFLPAAGLCDESELLDSKWGYYWSSTLCNVSCSWSCCLIFNSGGYRTESVMGADRYKGLSVRAVVRH